MDKRGGAQDTRTTLGISNIHIVNLYAHGHMLSRLGTHREVWIWSLGRLYVYIHVVALGRGLSLAIKVHVGGKQLAGASPIAAAGARGVERKEPRVSAYMYVVWCGRSGGWSGEARKARWDGKIRRMTQDGRLNNIEDT